jgi:hypothetical protein
MNIFRPASCLNHFFTPTDLGMPLHIAGGFCISGIQVLPNMPTVLTFPLAVLCITFKDMKTAAINVIDNGYRLEKCIDR